MHAPMSSDSCSKAAAWFAQKIPDEKPRAVFLAALTEKIEADLVLHQRCEIWLTDDKQSAVIISSLASAGYEPRRARQFFSFPTLCLVKPEQAYVATGFRDTAFPLAQPL